MLNKDILTFFNELKNLHSFYGIQDVILINNKEIPVLAKPVLIGEWFDSNMFSILNVLSSNGPLVSSQEFNNKNDCTTNFLQFYLDSIKLPVQFQKYLVI